MMCRRPLTTGSLRQPAQLPAPRLARNDVMGDTTCHFHAGTASRDDTTPALDLWRGPTRAFHTFRRNRTGRTGQLLLGTCNAGELRSGGWWPGPWPACLFLVVVGGDFGGEAGDGLAGGGLAGGVGFPAAERCFDFAGADAGAARGVQAGQDGAA